MKSYILSFGILVVLAATSTHASSSCQLFLSPISLSAQNFGSEELAPARHVRNQRERRRVVDLTKRQEIINQLDNHLRANVIAQPEVRNAILRVMERAIAIGSGRGTKGNILVPGETGVGKTLSFEELGRFIGAEIITLEGSNYTESHRVSELIGAPPSYVGHGSTEPVLNQSKIDAHKGSVIPITIILVNELDKAHPDFRDWFLKAMDDGTNTVWMPKEGQKNTAFAQKVDFSNSIFAATTNAGAEIIAQQSVLLIEKMKDEEPKLYESALGVGDFATPELEPEDFREDINNAILSVFKRPEFLGRFDEIPIAWRLLNAGYHRVVSVEIRKLRKKIETTVPSMSAMPLRATRSARQWLVDHRDPRFGARNISKLVKRYIETPVIRAISSGEIKDKNFVSIDVDDTGANLIVIVSESKNIQPSALTEKVSEQIRDVVQINSHQAEDQLSATEIKQQWALFDQKRLSPKNRLSAALKITKSRKLNIDEVLKILSQLPRGESWGYNNPTNYYPKNLFKEYGLTGWSINDFEALDIEIVYRALLSIDGRINSFKKFWIKSYAYGIVKHSIGYKNKKSEYQQELLTLIDLILSEKETIDNGGEAANIQAVGK